MSSATFRIVLHKILSNFTTKANCRDTVTSTVRVKHFKPKLSGPLVKGGPRLYDFFGIKLLLITVIVYILWFMVFYDPLDSISQRPSSSSLSCKKLSQYS